MGGRRTKENKTIMNGRSSHIVLWVVALSIMRCSLHAVPPPNDAFADRISLHGEDLLLDSVMEGSSLEQLLKPVGEEPFKESFSPFFDYFDCPSSGTLDALGSVWWSWIAPRSGTVVLIPEGYSDTPPPSAYGPGLSCFLGHAPYPSNFVFQTTGNAGIAQTIRNPSTARYSLGAFYATEGETYLFQSVGCAKGHYTFRLLMPHGPYVSEEPMDKILLEGESAFLHVTATGSPRSSDTSKQPLSYQWLRNGTPLQDEIYSYLLLDSVTRDQAGNYQVIVSDAEGSVTSAVAQVIVNAKESPPQLSVMSPSVHQPGELAPISWVLRGDPGCYYVIKSSTNLVDWHWQSIEAVSTLAQEPFTVTAGSSFRSQTSHVRIRHEPFAFRVNAPSRTLFLRAQRMQPFDPARTLALWILQHIKEDFARDPRWPRNLYYDPTMVDLSSRVHPKLRPLILGSATDCQAPLIFYTIGSPPAWPCLTGDPALWIAENYCLSNPAAVWNPAK